MRYVYEIEMLPSDCICDFLQKLNVFLFHAHQGIRVIEQFALPEKNVFISF